MMTSAGIRGSLKCTDLRVWGDWVCVSFRAAVAVPLGVVTFMGQGEVQMDRPSDSALDSSMQHWRVID